MKQVYVLGDGQLGRMLRQAGEPAGIKVWLAGEQATSADVPAPPDAITAEIERWPATSLTRQLEQSPLFVNRDVFPIIADRQRQKQLLDELNLAVARWQPLTDADQWPALFRSLGTDIVIKRRTGGYDGRGQWRITSSACHSADNDVPADCYGSCIAEQLIPFIAEVSLIGARSRRGDQVFFPLIRNLHQKGILRASIALPAIGAESALLYGPTASGLAYSALQHQAQSLLAAIMQRLDYIGVMAMECFVTRQGLLINELAPRVHNSGHWTQNGATVSQFALHLYALLDLPLPPPQIHQPTVMINLIGCELNYQWLSVPCLHLHWYHKQVRPGRKVGHLNLTAPDCSTLHNALCQLAPLLPADYLPVIDQVKEIVNKAR